MNRKGFTFVELMMVLLVISLIATLTMPILRNLVNKEDIYRGYLKKAIADVTDAFVISDLQSRSFTASNCTIGGSANQSCTEIFDNDSGFRDVFATFALNGENCAAGSCGNEFNASIGSIPGILIGKTMILFEHANTIVDDMNVKGYIYYDINGEKDPNSYCRDRFRFIFYQNPDNNQYGVVLDPNTCSACVNLAINK